MPGKTRLQNKLLCPAGS